MVSEREGVHALDDAQAPRSATHGDHGAGIPVAERIQQLRAPEVIGRGEVAARSAGHPRLDGDEPHGLDAACGGAHLCRRRGSRRQNETHAIARPKRSWAARARGAAAEHHRWWFLPCLLAGAVAHAAPPVIDVAAWRRAEPSLRSASVSLCAVNVATGDVLVAVDPDRVLIPASVTKLFTTAAALDARGVDYRVTTALLGCGALSSDGTLSGDLRFVGAGDPNFSARFDDSVTVALDSLVDALATRGVRRVTGDVIGDDTAWTDERLHPSWIGSDLGEWYGAEVSALSFNDNCLDFYFRGDGPVGARATYRIGPNTAYIMPQSTVRIGSPGSSSRIDMFRARGSRTLRATGSVAQGDSISSAGTVPDPALYAASVLRERLIARGIAVSGRARSARDDASPSACVPSVHVSRVSRPLADLVRVTNLRSQNLHAEVLLRLTDVGARVASVRGGLARGRATYARLGVDVDRMHLVDGSGLSREDRFSARALVQLLRGVQRSAPAWREAFWSSLPLSGRDGYLRRMAGGASDGRLRVKTGRMSGVRSVAGLAETPRGDLIAFAGIVNGRPGSERAAERMLDSLAVHLTLPR